MMNFQRGKAQLHSWAFYLPALYRQSGPVHTLVGTKKSFGMKKLALSNYKQPKMVMRAQQKDIIFRCLQAFYELQILYSEALDQAICG